LEVLKGRFLTPTPVPGKKFLQLQKESDISVPTTGVFTSGRACETFARNAFRELRVSPFIFFISEFVQQI
jgi:hypothetical protein